MGVLCGSACFFESVSEVLFIERIPWMIVVGTKSVGNAPICHGAVRVVRDGFFEALDCLHAVKGIHPC